jgi:hypothetical protein
MIAIKLKKIEYQDFVILQHVVSQLRLKRLEMLQNSIIDDAYFNNILTVDVATSLFFRLRMKIENDAKSFSNFRLKIYEAIVLLQCCNDYTASTEHEKFVTRKYFTEIHKQLVNL